MKKYLLCASSALALVISGGVARPATQGPDSLQDSQFHIGTDELATGGEGRAADRAVADTGGANGTNAEASGRSSASNVKASTSSAAHAADNGQSSSSNQNDGTASEAQAKTSRSSSGTGNEAHAEASSHSSSSSGN